MMTRITKSKKSVMSKTKPNPTQPMGWVGLGFVLAVATRS